MSSIFFLPQQLQDQLQREKKEAKENLAHQTNQYQVNE